MRRMLVLAAAVAVAAVLVVAGKSLAQDSPPQAGVPVDKCTSCHGQASMSMNMGNDKVSLYVTAADIANSVHPNAQCTDCHQGMTGYPHATAAPASLKAFRLSLSESCRACHLNQYYHAPGSAHTKAQAGDGPICTDCHTAHNIQSTKTPAFRPQSVAQCTQCHQNQTLMAKYGVNPKVAQTYLQDFHGETEALVSLQGPNSVVHEAVCIDCHGVHNIQKPETAKLVAASVNPSQICLPCHPGATSNFSTAFLSHEEPSISHSPVVFFATWFYRIMIPFVLIGLVIHIIFDLIAARRKEARNGQE